MDKMQLRITPEQADTIIDALLHVGDETQPLPDAGVSARTAAWLSWRRDKLWGPRRGRPASTEAQAALAGLTARLANAGHVVTPDADGE